MFKIKSYIGNYNKEKFYAVMGKYFAERVYKKRLPYLVNDKNKSWHLFYSKNELVGFVGLKISKTSTDITDIYYLESFMDKKILESMIVFIMDAYKNEIINVLTNNDYEIDIFKSYNFKEIKNRGSYVELKFGF